MSLLESIARTAMYVAIAMFLFSVSSTARRVDRLTEKFETLTSQALRSQGFRLEE